MGARFELSKKEGNFLIFETSIGESHLVSHQKLRELLKHEVSRIRSLDLVFISACTSESNGQIFQELGAKHVICIQETNLVRDSAIIRFTEQFYCKLFDCLNVCQAYKHAMDYLQQSPHDADQTQIIKMLKSPCHTCSDIKIESPYLKFVNLSPKIAFKTLPNKIKSLQFRTCQLTQLCGMLLDTNNQSNVVVVTGIQGSEKSFVVRNTLHFIAERRHFRHAFIWLTLFPFYTVEDLIRDLFK